ncbi:MMS19 nucleotide excision repair protein [Aphelenchoides besseyi]|nr:MMS19 nucleotide excision repair protein [Aphelenchoides besseyi]KAI6199393.1 MMS19 nucleotide excision repair protein [Aphelenchoides besseyi]
MQHSNIFDAPKRLELDTIVRDIVDGKQRLDVFCGSLRDDMTAREPERRAFAVNQLSYCVINLPATSLTGPETQSILSFLVTRLNDTGHLCELLVSGIHKLFFAVDIQEVDYIDRIFRNIYEETSIQSYIQADRLKFFEIFEYIAQNFFQVIESTNLQFYALFSNAVSGERDPRCLLKVFTIFAYVMQRMDLGATMEDMFELVACYYPIEYSPRSEDKNPLTAATLTAACESCFLSNRAFSFYTYQLIAEKLTEEEENVKFETKLGICRFLEDACEKFGVNALLPMLENFLTGFRMLALNPQNRSKDRESVEIVGRSLKAVLKTIERMPDNAEKVINDITNEMLENCEPFVLQAEMGLASKAFLLLEKMATSSQYTAKSIVPKVFYWLYALITGLTVKNLSNKEEIVEETLPEVPKWFQIASNSGQLKAVLQSTPPLFDAITNTDSASARLKLQVLCESSGIILAAKDVEVNEELKKRFQIAFENVLNPMKDIDSKTSEILSNFLRHYAVSNAEQAQWLIQKLKEKEKWTSQEFLYLAALIKCPRESNEELALFLDRWTTSDNVDDGIPHLLSLFKNLNLGYSDEINEHFISPLFNHIVQNKPTKLETQEKLGNFLQDFGLLLSDEQFKFLIDLCLKQIEHLNSSDALSTITILSPLCLVETNVATPMFVLKKLKSFENLDSFRPYIRCFFFALKNRGGSKEFDELKIDFPNFEWDLDLISCKLEMLTGTTFPTNAVARILNEAPVTTIPELLNFHTSLTDPQKCNFKRTFMWAQRLLVQFVPFFLNYFTELAHNEEATKAVDRERRQSIIGLVASILQLAKRVPIPMTNELKLLFPIIIEALREAGPKDRDLPLLLDVATQLLQISTYGDFTPDKIGQLSDVMEKFLMSDQCPLPVAYSVLEVVELLAKRAPSRLEIFRWESTLGALKHVAYSKNRVLRQKGAVVRNLWEMIKV